ncbi:MAG TPA: glycosyltransferase [Thermomicrobiales bacterium]|nr:glycosyltransferase [Thermomicrobiales bacterium]
MLGTFSAWRLGTLQARALPLAIALRGLGVRSAIVTVPWDRPSERGVIDSISGIPVVNTRAVSPALAALAMAEQRATLRALRPRLVHVFKPKGFGGFTAALERSVPLLVDADDWEGDGGWNRQGSYSVLQRRLFDRQERRLQRDADGVTAASTLLTHRARQLRAHRHPESVYHLPNGLPSEWFTQLRDAGMQREVSDPHANRRIVLYSRFAEFADDWLSRFAVELDGHLLSRVELCVVGETTDQLTGIGFEFLEVNQLGYVARNQLPHVLGSSCIAVFPFDDSLVTRSKNSVKLLELMAAGCAVVATDTGDIARTLGAAGVLVSGSDPAVMADEVARLLDNSTARSAHAALGPRRVQAQFLIEKTAATLRHVYERHVASWS